jgi:hypothetical protein
MSTCVDQAWLKEHPEILTTPRRSIIDKAHPYPPGSGPKGQFCSTCQKCVCRHFTRKRFYKCRVMMKTWTGGKGTDIRLKDPACRSWEPCCEKLDVFSTVARGAQH